MIEAYRELRPLGLGELVDRSARFWRTRLKPLFQLVLGFQLALYLIQKAMVLAGQRYFPALTGFGAIAQAQEAAPEELFGQLAVGGAAIFAALVLTLAVSWAANVAVSRFIVDELLGRPASFQRSLGRVWRKAGTLAGVFALVHLWTAAVIALAMIPGIGVVTAAFFVQGAAVLVLIVLGYGIMVLGFVFAVLWYLLRFMLVPTVLAVEETGIAGTIRRSGQLVSGRLGPGLLNRVFIRATVVLTVIVVIVVVVALVTSLPAGLVQVAYGNLLDPAHANPAGVPQWLLVPAELFEVVCAAIISPLSLVLFAVFYLDVRMRREGLDLELKLTALESAEASAP